MSRLMLLALAVVALLGCTGCAVWPSYNPQKVDLAKYDHLVVAPFQADPKAGQFTSDRNSTLCAKIVEHAKKKPGEFKDITTTPTGQPNELILTGMVLDYDPGDPYMRMMLIGLGPAHFKINVRLEDGATHEVLSESQVSSLFVFGGMIGGAVQEPVFVNDLGRAIGEGVIRARAKP